MTSATIDSSFISELQNKLYIVKWYTEELKTFHNQNNYYRLVYYIKSLKYEFQNLSKAYEKYRID